MKPEFVKYALKQRGREVVQLRCNRKWIIWTVNFGITEVSLTLMPAKLSEKQFLKTITWDDYIHNYEQSYHLKPVA